MTKQATQQSSNQQASEVTYFDFISTGIGYLNRVREVTPKHGRRGDTYTACTINVIVGPSDAVEYREFDMRVVGSQAFEALNIIDQARQGDNDKIIVTFRAGDARPEDYTFQRKDSRSGEVEPVRRFKLKGRLLQIMSAKINGVPLELPQVERPVSDSTESTPGAQGHDSHGDDEGLDQHEGADTRPQPQTARQPARQSGYRQRAA